MAGSDDSRVASAICSALAEFACTACIEHGEIRQVRHLSNTATQTDQGHLISCCQHRPQPLWALLLGRLRDADTAPRTLWEESALLRARQIQPRGRPQSFSIKV